MIPASALRTPIVIEERIQDEDELGQPIDTWQTVITCFASVRHLSGVEAIKADASVSITKASIMIRYRSGLNAGMRVIGPDGTFMVDAVMNNKKAGDTTLVCESVQ